MGKADKHIVTGNGQRRLRKFAQGWKLEVLWKDGSTSWIPLKDLKESNNRLKDTMDTDGKDLMASPFPRLRWP